MRRAFAITSASILLALALQSQVALAAWTQATGTSGIRFQSISQVGTTLYAGSSTPTGLYQSTDGGMTWTTAFGGTFSSVLPFFVKQVGSVLYVGGSAGGSAYLAYSTDSGTNWTVLQGAGNWGTANRVTDVALIDGVTFLAASGSGVYRSASNDGTGWVLSNSGMNISPSKFAQIGATIYVSTTYNAANQDGVFKSTDGGANWSRSATGLPTPSGGSGARLINVGGTLFVDIGAGVYSSIDGGQNWTPSYLGDQPSLQGVVLNNGTIYFSAAFDFANGAGPFGNNLRTTTNGGLSWVVRRHRKLTP